MVNDNNVGSYSREVHYEGGTALINGYATQDGMESIQGQKGTLKVQGVISGKQDAYVESGGASYYAPGECPKMIGSATRLGVPGYVRGGDSGGPFWWPTSTGNHMVTVLTGSKNSFSYSGCNASGKVGRPAYGYPFWRVANNTQYTIPYSPEAQPPPV